MVRISIKNLDDFIKAYDNAKPMLKQTLIAAFPQLYKQLQDSYTKATQVTNQLRQGLPHQTTEITKEVTPKVSNIKKVGSVISKGAKGVGALTARLAPIQGAANLFAKDSDVTDRLSGAGMIGTGIASAAGVTGAAPWAAALVAGDLLKKHVSKPVGEMIGGGLARLKYGNQADWFDPNIGLLDSTTDMKGNLLTPEQRDKVLAWNDKVLANLAEKNRQALIPYGMQEVQPTNQVGEVPSNYNNQVPTSQGVPTNNIGIIPQNAQNAQEGGLNEVQDILQVNPYKPSLNPIIEPVNYSNEYLTAANKTINQLNQGDNNQMVDINPYSQLRGYNNIQQAPIPQNIREDVLPEYLQVMEGIRGKQGQVNYADILNQYNAAMEANRKQNQLNQMSNILAVQPQRPPVYYVGANGDLRSIEVEQPAQGIQLPTNTTANADRLLGQLKIQRAEQADMLAQQKAYRDLLQAQQEREDTIAQANALAKQFGGDPAMYMNKDIVNALLKETINPNIQSQANIQEAIGKAPTQANLKRAEQLTDFAGRMDLAQLNNQYQAMIANINNNAKMQEQAMIQSGLDRRTAATIANQNAINQFTQMMENVRAYGGYTSPREMQEAKMQNAYNIAQLYANKQGGEKQPQTQQDIINNMILEGVKSGTQIPQLLKYIDLIGTNKGLTSAEDAELNR